MGHEKKVNLIIVQVSALQHLLVEIMNGYPF